MFSLCTNLAGFAAPGTPVNATGRGYRCKKGGPAQSVNYACDSPCDCALQKRRRCRRLVESAILFD